MGIRSCTMCQVGVLILGLFLMNCLPAVDSRIVPHVRRDVMGFSSMAGNKVPMQHRDSLAGSDLSFEQRVRNAVKSSGARLKSIAARSGNVQVKEFASGSGNETFGSVLASDQGIYLMEVSLGTPAQTFTVIADTGSDLVWVQCTPCLLCFTQTDPLFDPANSSSYLPVSCASSICSDLPSSTCTEKTCHYTYEYGDESITTGDMATESIAMVGTSGMTAFKHFVFGCGHEDQFSFQNTVVDGLVGLGGGPLSLTSQLGRFFGNKFAYCLVSFYDAPSQASSIIFGDNGVPPTDFSFTPLLSSPLYDTFYYLSLTGISVDSKLLPIPKSTFAISSDGSGGVIIDSGTTITYFVQPAYDLLHKALQSLIHYEIVDGSQTGLDLCYNLADVPHPKFPVVTIHFEGFDLSLPDSNVFLRVDTQGTSCLAFLPSFFPLSIFGNVQQQNYIIEYDRGHSRIGFVPFQCDS